VDIRVYVCVCVCVCGFLVCRRIILFFQRRFAVQYWVCIKFHAVSDCDVIYLPENRKTTTNNNKRNARGDDRKNYFLAAGGVERVFIFVFIFSSSSFEQYLLLLYTHTHVAFLYIIRLPAVVISVVVLYYIILFAESLYRRLVHSRTDGDGDDDAYIIAARTV